MCIDNKCELLLNLFEKLLYTWWHSIKLNGDGDERGEGLTSYSGELAERVAEMRDRNRDLAAQTPSSNLQTEQSVSMVQL